MSDRYAFVLAKINPPSIWNFYPTLDAAREDNERANASAAKYGETGYTPMTYEDYKRHERAFYLQGEPEGIHPATFDKMHDVLPPKCVQSGAGWYSFLMAEHWSGVYTHQYLQVGNRYWCKLVDATDRTTWMTPEERRMAR